MFFSITKQIQPNFPYNHQTGNFVISLDEGWTSTTDANNNPIWFKGYLDQGILADAVLSIIEETEPTYSGNFCVIRCLADSVNIRSDRQRSFPIWVSDDSVTNLTESPTTIWADDVIDVDFNFNIKHYYFDIIGSISNDITDFDTVVKKIDAILDQKTKSFLANQSEPIKVFLSGGIDTALVFSYVQKHTDQYEIVNGFHCDFDYFFLKNHGTLSKHWGYGQIHHWRNSCVLASGAPGDEYMMRSPTTANLMLKHYGTSIPELLKGKYNDCLHSIYFSNPKYHDMWDKQSIDDIELSAMIKICSNYNVNDWQHWHFGNTLTWTPLRDIEIFKLVASLPLSELKEQVMNSKLSIELIRRNNPKILSLLSTKKNSNNYLENLTSFYLK